MAETVDFTPREIDTGAVLQTAIADTSPNTFGPDGIVDLKIGHCGRLVTQLQCLLTALGYSTTEGKRSWARDTPVTGKFDENTAMAVILFQQNAGLPLSGKIDAATRKKLYTAYIENKAAADAAIKYESEREQVIQKRRQEVLELLKNAILSGNPQAILAFIKSEVNAKDGFSQEKYGGGDFPLVVHIAYKAALKRAPKQTVAGLGRPYLRSLRGGLAGEGESAPPLSTGDKLPPTDEDLMKSSAKEVVEYFVDSAIRELTDGKTLESEQQLMPLYKEAINTFVSVLEDTTIKQIQDAGSRGERFNDVFPNPKKEFFTEFSQMLLEEVKRREAAAKAVPPAPPPEPTPPPPPPPVPAPPEEKKSAVQSYGPALLLLGIGGLVLYSLVKKGTDNLKGTPPTLNGYTTALPPQEDLFEEEEEEDEDEE